MTKFLALVEVLSNVGGGGYPDQGLPGGGGSPDQGLPGAGGSPDQSLPWAPGRPDQGLPGGGWQGRPDQGLPGGRPPHIGIPIFPEYPSGGTKPVEPDEGSPEHQPSQGGAAGAVKPTGLVVIVYHPSYGWIAVAAGKPGGGSGGSIDNELPGSQPGVDNELPGSPDSPTTKPTPKPQPKR